MPFEGLGQAIYEKGKIMICIELVEEGVLSIENASSFLNITKDDFDKAINELKFETGN